jgi:ribosome-binding factor A
LSNESPRRCDASSIINQQSATAISNQQLQSAIRNSQSAMASTRPTRIGDQIRVEIADLLAREVHDPGIGFLTVTHVRVTPDLQQARVYYTTLGDDKARRDSRRALERAAPFLRRQLGRRLRLRRIPELQFFFDESIERQDRIEQILQQIHAEEAEGDKGPLSHDRSGHDDPDREEN